MKLVGMMPARNEDWVLALSARAALRWCDALVIFDHASTDGTIAIIDELMREYGDRVTAFGSIDSQWNEMEHRQGMLEVARESGASHLAIIDADEVLTGNLAERMRSMVESLSRGFILQLPGYNLRGGIDSYHSTGIWSDRWFSVAFANDPRLGWFGDRFHQREPQGCPMTPRRPIAQGQGGVLHLWGASERRLIAKHALYKMTERLRWPNKPVRQIDQLYDLAFRPEAAPQYAQKWLFRPVPEEWWSPYRDLLRLTALDEVPWQEQACTKLLADYGPEPFDGLNLFGVRSLRKQEVACE